MSDMSVLALLAAQLLLAPPVILDVRPPACSSPVITGTGFSEDSVVTLDGRPVSSKVLSHSSIKMEIGEAFLRRPGTGWLEVRNPGGERSVPYPFPRTWELVSSIPAERITGVAAGRDSSGHTRILASTSSKLYLAIDEPFTFVEVDLGEPFFYSSIVSMAVAPGRTEEIWIGVRRAMKPGVLRTTDGGKNWKPVPVPEKGFGARLFAAMPDGTAFAAGHPQIWRLNPRGDPYPLPAETDAGPLPVGSAAVDSRGGVWANAFGDLYRLIPANGPWKRVEIGDANDRVRGVITDAAGREILVWTDNEMLYLSTDGRNWRKRQARYFPLVRDPNHEDRLWGATYHGVVGYRAVSEQHSDGWIECQGIPPRSGVVDVFEPAGRYLYAATERGLFRLEVTPPPAPRIATIE
jgi:hypothetical protein